MNRFASIRVQPLTASFDYISSRSLIEFCVGSHHEIEKQSMVKVTSKELYSQDPFRTPVQNGVLDRRMVGH